MSGDVAVRGTPSVRPASPADRAAVWPLARGLAHSFSPTEAAFRATFATVLADEDALLLVAERAGDVVGYLLGVTHATFFADGPVGWVEELMVADGARRQGTGSALVSAYEEWAAARGARLVALATRRARDFYLNLGYEDSASYLRRRLP